MEDLKFKVVGITFKNREDNLLEIIDNGVAKGYLKPYLGLTSSEMKERDLLQLGEFDEQRLADIKLEETTYENKKAIKVLISDYENNYLEIGFVPEDLISDVEKVMHLDCSVVGYITGGKFKNIEEDDIIERTLGYGVRIEMKIKAQ